jgi:sigma-70-like protein
MPQTLDGFRNNCYRLSSLLMTTIDVKNLVKTVVQLVKALNPRNRDIISRRFGLKNGTKETLESIGKSYGITRERVRQIEEFALGQLAKAAPDSRDLARAVAGARECIAREGGVMREHALFKAVSGNDKDSATNAALAFALTLDRELVRVADNDRFHAFWATDAATLDGFKAQVQSLVNALESHGAVTDHDGLLKLAGVSIAQMASMMSVSKDIGRNIFGELGLSHWNQIRPKGVRDKAYLVIKKAGKPQHFSSIAKLINQAKFDVKKTNVQTVHNELIKDKRFVLVGRGMYALSEWGYKAGTVKDVLTDILRTHGKPLPRADLVARVMDVRIVKENTVLLNLQDSGTFSRDENGHYHLRKK